MLVANHVEALLATGDWDRADSLSAALRASTASYPYMVLILRAEVEIGRGDFDAARAHLDAAPVALRRPPRRRRGRGHHPERRRLAQRARLELGSPDAGPPDQARAWGSCSA